jgi:hypothetical protein
MGKGVPAVALGRAAAMIRIDVTAMETAAGTSCRPRPGTGPGGAGCWASR